jgi:hypothetical protein
LQSILEPKESNPIYTSSKTNNSQEKPARRVNRSNPLGHRFSFEFDSATRADEAWKRGDFVAWESARLEERYIARGERRESEDMEEYQRCREMPWGN